METKILRLLIVALGFLIVLVIALSILFAVSLGDVKNSIQKTNRDANIVEAIKSLKTINGRDGLSIEGKMGVSGRDGKDSVSTVVIQQQPIQGQEGKPGKDGKDAAPAKEIVFDGQGNWKFNGDEEWLPLFQKVEE